MATDTKEHTYVVDGVEITLDPENEGHKRLIAQMNNIKAAEEEKIFNEKMDTFLTACQDVISQQANGFEDMLEGQTLLWDFGDEKPVLKASNLVEIRTRRLK